MTEFAKCISRGITSVEVLQKSPSKWGAASSLYTPGQPQELHEAYVTAMLLGLPIGRQLSKLPRGLMDFQSEFV